MESVYFGDKIANKNQLSPQTTALNLRPQAFSRAASRSTQHSSRDHICVRIGGVVWQLPFVSRQVAAPGEAHEQLPRGVTYVEAYGEFEVEDRELLQAVYGDTYESVSVVDGHRFRQSSDLVQRLECEVVWS